MQTMDSRPYNNIIITLDRWFINERLYASSCNMEQEKDFIVEDLKAVICSAIIKYSMNMKFFASTCFALHTHGNCARVFFCFLTLSEGCLRGLCFNLPLG